MNGNDPIDELTNLRFTRELRAAARQVELSPGSELAVVAAGRRKRHRRRQATALMVVVAVGGGTALVVQQLARTGESSIATDDPTTTEGPVSTDPSTTATSVPVAATNPGSVAPDVTTIASPPPVAQLVESNLVWNVVEPDSAEAVSFVSYGMSATFTVPGMVVATAPGRSDEGQQAVWRTEDGITWTPTDVTPPVGSPYNLAFDGSTVYNVGTAPGVAAESVNPLIVAMSVDEGATWSQIELPIDANAGRQLPMVRGASAYGQPIAIDGGLLVLAHQSVDLDWSTVMERTVGEKSDSFFDMNRDGFRVLADADCAPGSAPMTVPVAEMYTAATVAPYADSPMGDCEMRTVTWVEAGVPPETVAAMFDNTQRAFVVRDGVATEVDLPRDTWFQNIGADGQPRFVTPKGEWYRFDDSTDSFLPTEASGVPTNAWYVGAADGVGWAIDSVYPPFGGASRSLIGHSSADGEWAWVDWTNLTGDATIARSASVALTGAGLTNVVAVSSDPFAATGGVEVSVEGITMKRDSSFEVPEFSDAATGAPIPLELVFSDQSTGGLIVRDETGATLVATLDHDDVAKIFGVDSGEAADDLRWMVQTSADGSHVAVESIAELLKISDAEISSVPRISTDGSNTIVVVTLKERNADGVPRQLVLVGTPRN